MIAREFKEEDFWQKNLGAKKQEKSSEDFVREPLQFALIVSLENLAIQCDEGHSLQRDVNPEY